MKSLYAKTSRQREIQLILHNNLFFFLKIILKIQHIKFIFRCLSSQLGVDLSPIFFIQIALRISLRCGSLF